MTATATATKKKFRFLLLSGCHIEDGHQYRCGERGNEVIETDQDLHEIFDRPVLNTQNRKLEENKYPKFRRLHESDTYSYQPAPEPASTEDIARHEARKATFELMTAADLKKHCDAEEIDTRGAKEKEDLVRIILEARG